jgi:hypothetical protein
MSPVGILASAGIVMILLAFPLIIFPFLTLVDCVRNPNLSTQSKIAWFCLILFTWTLGASIYSFAATQRPFFRVMAVVVIVLTAVGLYLRSRKPQMEQAQSQAQERLKAQIQTSYVQEWQHYKPIYDAVGLTEIWSMMDSGKCDEAEMLLQAPETYQKMDKTLGAASRATTIATSLKVCRERFAPPVAVNQAAPQDLNQNPMDRLRQSINAGKNLGALGNMRIALSQCYSDTDGHYPATLQGIIGKKTLDNAVLQSIPSLALPDHPETNEVMTYGGDVCAPAGGYAVDGSKIKDTGKWGYVSDPKSTCYGTVFIDCTHMEPRRNKPWYSF